VWNERRRPGAALAGPLGSTRRPLIACVFTRDRHASCAYGRNDGTRPRTAKSGRPPGHRRTLKRRRGPVRRRTPRAARFFSCDGASNLPSSIDWPRTARPVPAVPNDRPVRFASLLRGRRRRRSSPSPTHSIASPRGASTDCLVRSYSCLACGSRSASVSRRLAREQLDRTRAAQHSAPRADRPSPPSQSRQSLCLERSAAAFLLVARPTWIPLSLTVGSVSSSPVLLRLASERSPRGPARAGWDLPQTRDVPRPVQQPIFTRRRTSTRLGGGKDL